MSARGASYGWERWPTHKSLDGLNWLCRWCHKVLTGRQTAWCSEECEREVVRRCVFASLRLVIYERDGGRCVKCGVDLAAIERAFAWYKRKYDAEMYQNKTGLPPHEANKRRALMAHWPHPQEFQKAAGFDLREHVWECNHKAGIAEGGDPVDPDNLETLCLRCHKQHTAALVKRVAKMKRVQQKFRPVEEIKRLGVTQ